MSFESTTEHYRNLQRTEILTYCINEMSFESITEIWTYCTQRYDVWEDYRNLNLLHSTRCRSRALQKSEIITQDVVREHYRNLNLLHQRNVVWEHYRNLNLLHSTRCRLRALQKSELIALNESIEIVSTRCRLRALQKSERIALNEMSFESITEIWTYFTQRYDVWEHYRNLNLLHSTRCRYRNLNLLHQRDTFESITEILTYCINEMSFESITEI